MPNKSLRKRAADNDMIKYAVRKHFVGVSDDLLVTNYYDKLIQVPIRVPQLGTQEVRAFIMLLFVDNIRECGEHDWMQDRADPHARDRARALARRDPPAGISPDEGASNVRDVLDSIGDTCPECPPEDQGHRTTAPLYEAGEISGAGMRERLLRKARG